MSIGTSISLTDGLTSTLQNITNALNLTVSAFYSIQDATIDISSFEAVRNEINAATISIQNMAEAVTNIPPVQAPVEPVWTSNIVAVFQGSGIERYNQEIHSANDMTNRLAAAQQQIAAQAAGVSVFPANMVSDLSVMNSRIERIRAAIEQVQNNPINTLGADQANGELERLRGQLHQALNEQEAMNVAMERMDISAANAAYERLNSIIDSTDRGIRDNIDEQGRFNAALHEGVNRADGLGNKIQGFIGAYMGLQGLQRGAGLIGEWLGVADVGVMAERQLSVVMQNMGMVEAEFDAIKSKAQLLQETTAFGADTLVAGAAELASYLNRGESIQAMMDTLTDYAAGMSGGAAVDKNAMVAYATSLGKALDGQYEGLSKKGFTVTNAQKDIIENGKEMERVAVIQDIIAQSWDGMAQAMVNTPMGALQQMSNTWSDIQSRIGNGLYPSVMVFFNALSNNLPMAEQLLMQLATTFGFIIEWIGSTGLPTAISATEQLLNIVSAVGSFVSQNWGVVEPVIWGIVSAITAYVTITKIWSIVTWLQVAANQALIISLLTNPITWIAVAIGVVIGLIYNWIQSVGGIRIAWAIVVNDLLAKWDALKLVFFTGVYYVLDLWDTMKLGMMAAGVAIANFMGDMKADVLIVLQNMVNGAIDIINDFIGTLNKIPGVNVDFVNQVTFGTNAALEAEAARQARESGLKAYRDEIKAGIDERAVKLQDMKFEAIEAISQRQAELDALKLEAANKTDTQPQSTYEYDWMQKNPVINEIANNTSDIKKSMEMSGEDLKYLLDLAERDYVNRFTTAEVTIQLGGVNNTVSQNVDLDGMVSYLEEKLTETLASVAEGIHT